MRRITEFYIAVLLKFKDDDFVMPNEQIKTIGEALKDKDISCELKHGVLVPLRLEDGKSRYEDKPIVANEFSYRFSEAAMKSIVEDLNTEVSRVFLKRDEWGRSEIGRFCPPQVVCEDACPINTEVYFYHHRLVIKYKIQACFGTEVYNFRHVRSAIKEQADSIIRGLVSRINEVEYKGSTCNILGYFSHTIVFSPKENGFEEDFENLIGTQLLRIPQIEGWGAIWPLYHYVRISIPSVIVYYSGRIGDTIKAEIINAVYQVLLYKMKESAKKGYKKIRIPLSIRQYTDTFNRVKEEDLEELWRVSYDVFGGKVSDEIEHRNIWRGNLIALIILLLTIVTFGLTLYDFITKQQRNLAVESASPTSVIGQFPKLPYEFFSYSTFMKTPKE